MTAIVKFKPTCRVTDWALWHSQSQQALLAACNTVSLWSVGEAPGPLSLTGTTVLYNDAANVSASEGSNQAKLPPRPHPQRSACS